MTLKEQVEKSCQECRVEETTGGKVVVYVYGKSTACDSYVLIDPTQKLLHQKEE